MATARANDGIVVGRPARQESSESKTESGRSPRSATTLTVLGLLALLGIAGLTALGIWQVERRAWKLDLIARSRSAQPRRARSCTRACGVACDQSQ